MANHVRLDSLKVKKSEITHLKENEVQANTVCNVESRPRMTWYQGLLSSHWTNIVAVLSTLHG